MLQSTCEPNEQLSQNLIEGSICFAPCSLSRKVNCTFLEDLPIQKISEC
jgi:hypothetical protein